jgi:hypothetical protein
MCDTTETMEHILTRCREPPIQMIWTLTEQSWPREHLEWPTITLGLILGCGWINKNDNERQEGENRRWQWEQKGASRLATILISEAAHLIWVLRCKRVIRDRQHSDNEISTRWRNTINTRLTSDKIIATKIKCKNKFTNLVVNTWKPLLTKDRPLPHNWITNHEVLVGRRP